jgi:hypothetical protein
MPAVPSGCTYTNKVVNANETLNPGTYCGGLTVSGGSTRVTLNAGSYFMVGGGITLQTNSRVTGTGVTIINTYDATYPFREFRLRTGVSVNLSAPTSGDLSGILFFEDPSAPSGYVNEVATGSGSSLVGSLYTPVNRIAFQTGSSLTITGGIVAKSIICRTGADLTFTGYTSGVPYAIKRVSLVE